MGARNLRCMFGISEGNSVGGVSCSLLLGTAYHDVGVPAGVVMR